MPREAYDDIVSSGDVTRSVIAERHGQSLCHIGPERDRSIFTGLNVQFAPLESADYVVCSGLDDDDVETPEDYRARLDTMLKRKLFMLCGNPDLVVERGDRLVYCAGSIADLYADHGRRGALCRQALPADLRHGAGQGRAGRRQETRACARAGDRRFDPHRSERRAQLGIDFLF